MSDDRNNDFDDFQGFDGSNDFGDPNADGMHFSEEELEAAMAGFEQEFKDAEASKNERTDNPPSKALDSSEASDDAESSESSGIDDMLNAAEDSLKFEDELQGLLGNRAKVAVIITRLTSPRLLAAFCELSDISAQCIGSAQGAVAVLRNLDGDGPEAAVKDMTIVVAGMPAILAVNRADKLEATMYVEGKAGKTFAPPVLFTSTAPFVEDLMLGITDMNALEQADMTIFDSADLDRDAAMSISPSIRGSDAAHQASVNDGKCESSCRTCVTRHKRRLTP